MSGEGVLVEEAEGFNRKVLSWGRCSAHWWDKVRLEN